MRWRASLFLPLLIAAAPFEQTGPATWYGYELAGSRTATGEHFDPEGMTAAHRTLPLNSWADVTSLDNGRTVRVRINDRGPYHTDRIIDLSESAARRLGPTGRGSRHVLVRAVEPGTAQVDAPLAALRARSGWTPPPDETMPTGEGPYFVQLATFESKHRAEALAARFGAGIDRARGLYRVRVGPLTGARQVNGALARLAASGYPGAVVVR